MHLRVANARGPKFQFTVNQYNLLREVLQHTKGNLSHAAKALGIARATLRAKLESLSINAVNDSDA